MQNNEHNLSEHNPCEENSTNINPATYYYESERAKRIKSYLLNSLENIIMVFAAFGIFALVGVFVLWVARYPTDEADPTIMAAGIRLFFAFAGIEIIIALVISAIKLRRSIQQKTIEESIIRQRESESFEMAQQLMRCEAEENEIERMFAKEEFEKQRQYEAEEKEKEHKRQEEELERDRQYEERQNCLELLKYEMDRQKKELEIVLRYSNMNIVNSMDGRQFEYFVARLMKSRGFTHVEVTQASRDNGADVIAVSPDGVRVCVQCKNYNQPVGVSAVQEIVAAKPVHDCELAYVFTNSTFTKHAEDLAKANNVQLIDGKKLNKIMNDNNRSILEALKNDRSFEDITDEELFGEINRIENNIQNRIHSNLYHNTNEVIHFGLGEKKAIATKDDEFHEINARFDDSDTLDSIEKELMESYFGLEEVERKKAEVYAGKNQAMYLEHMERAQEAHTKGLEQQRRIISRGGALSHLSDSRTSKE